MVVYFSTATNHRSRGALWSIIALPFILGSTNQGILNSVDMLTQNGVVSDTARLSVAIYADRTSTVLGTNIG